LFLEYVIGEPMLWQKRVTIEPL